MASVETEKSKEKSSEGEPKDELSSKYYPGFLQNGKFLCDCEGNPEARCLSVIDVTKDTYRKKYWRCSKFKCKFYLWDDQIKEAKEWHQQYGPPPPVAEPKTPTSKQKGAARSPETPWTIAKGKRKAVEVSDGEEEERPSSLFEIMDGNGEAVEETGNPFKKPEESTVVTTPFIERLKNIGLPNSDAKPAADPAMRLDTPVDFGDCGRRESDLADKVMGILKREKLQLKEGTEISIRHEIELDMRLKDTKIQMLEEMTAKLKKRLNELEGAFDEPVELSD